MYTVYARTHSFTHTHTHTHTHTRTYTHTHIIAGTDSANIITVQYSAVHYTTLQHSTVQYTTALQHTLQHTTTHSLHYTTLHYSTLQHLIFQVRTEQLLARDVHPEQLPPPGAPHGTLAQPALRLFIADDTQWGSE